ncbi:LysR family transcriptional regulator [Alteromonas sp. KUL150]|uniref:LysR family transcriptional regulator n=1 Tax=Alteromonas sp. KUL150 TaxID=2480805 RepID=UPI0012E605D1|nr:LysR family transcriptional regulator [Alteromonas sp. KUL150]GFD86156.1 LysR family transcriptional regulator [Alteromonas sp. KUL150]
MNWKNIAFDWNQVRAFLAAAEEGSLSAAARALKQTQPTLSRQVTSLEDTLGVTLFERGHRNLQLTEAGLELLEYARTMAEAANNISLAACGQSQTIEGRVRITATEMFATYYLPSMLRKLRELAPGIVIEVVASDLVRDLIRREADIAIRHAQPNQPDLIARRLGSLRGRIYAAKRLLDEVGVPREFGDLENQDFIGIEDTESLIENLAGQGLNLRIEQFKAFAGSGNCMLQLIREGLGFGFLPMDTGKLFNELVCVLPEQFDPEIPVWLVSHRELYTSRRIRTVFDFIAQELQGLTE